MGGLAVKSVVPETRQAVLYLRVSTEEQVENYSLETQAEICKREADRRGLEIAQVFREEGRSAKTMKDRPALIQLLEFCRRHKREVNSVIVYRLDRISRQTADYLAIRKKLADYEITIISATEPTGDTPTEKFVETLLAGFAQMDNDVRSERTKNGLRARFLAGLHNATAPMGYRAQNGYVVKDPETFENIRAAWELMATGTKSLGEIIQFLNEAGVRNRRKDYGERTLRKQTVSKMFRNKFYAGKVVSRKHGLEAQGQHVPMITEELFYKVQAILDGRLTASPDLSHRVQDKEDFPLRRVIKCSICLEPFTGAWSKGRLRRYGYYFCHKRCYMGKSVPVDLAEEHLAKLLTSISLKSETIDLIMDRIRKRYQERLAPILRLRDQADAEIKRLKELRQALITKNLTGVYSDDVYKEQNAMLEDQLKTVYEAKNETTLEKYKLEDISAFMHAKFEDWNKTYQKASLEQKKILLCSTFPEGMMWQYPGLSNTKISPFYRAFLDVEQGDKFSGARERSRTSTPCGTCPSDKRVYHSTTRAGGNRTTIA